jgi:CTP:molybdopterin cytidylyltransferase MocA
MDSSKGVSVVILAAGFSERMGREKFALMFDDTHSFLEKISETYAAFGCNEIIVVLSRKGMALKDTLGLKLSDRVTFVENKHPEKERFYSLQNGLRALKQSEYVFIQHIDNPFVEPELLKRLFEMCEEGIYVVPSYMGKGGHPVLVSLKIVEAIVKHSDVQVKLNEFLKEFTRLKIETESCSILYNINDPDTYRNMFHFTNNLKDE